MYRIRCIMLLMPLLCMSCQLDQSTASIPPPESDSTNAEATCPADVLNKVDTDYGNALTAYIDSGKFYLKLVSARHLSGNTTLCVQLRRDGSLLRAYVLESSGSALLDGSALYATGRAFAKSSMPTVPEGLGGDADNLWFAVPLQFVDADPGGAALIADVPSCVSVKKTYFKDLRAAIKRRIFYPIVAGYRGEEGHAKIRFTITADGRFQNAKIVETAGDPLFDASALITLGFVDIGVDRPCRPAELTGSDGHDPVKEVPFTWQIPSLFRK